jgi:hypothetical protein
VLNEGDASGDNHDREASDIVELNRVRRRIDLNIIHASTIYPLKILYELGLCFVVNDDQVSEPKLGIFSHALYCKDKAG